MQIEIIDFHSHILPGMDDGSPDVPTSLEMLRAAARQGVGVQVLTPHYYPWREEIGSFLSRRTESAETLLPACDETLPRLLVGAEVAFFPHMSELDLTSLCIGSTRALLVELPFESWDGRVEEQLATLTLDRGYKVILAHVERYVEFQRDKRVWNRVMALPVTFQLNAEDFLKRDGLLRRDQKKRFCLEFLSQRPDTILGSDCHNLTGRRPNLADARQVIAEALGESALERADMTVKKALGL